MWKSVSIEGPASTTQNRTRSPGSAVSGCFTYWPAYPLKVIQSAMRACALGMSKLAGVVEVHRVRNRTGIREREVDELALANMDHRPRCSARPGPGGVLDPGSDL